VLVWYYLIEAVLELCGLVGWVDVDQDQPRLARSKLKYHSHLYQLFLIPKLLNTSTVTIPTYLFLKLWMKSPEKQVGHYFPRIT
jgi:hypothetical protein